MEENFANYLSDKGLTSRMHKELKNLKVQARCGGAHL
jgi:hypothetical protein